MIMLFSLWQTCGLLMNQALHFPWGYIQSVSILLAVITCIGLLSPQLFRSPQQFVTIIIHNRPAWLHRSHKKCVCYIIIARPQQHYAVISIDQTCSWKWVGVDVTALCLYITQIITTLLSLNNLQQYSDAITHNGYKCNKSKALQNLVFSETKHYTVRTTYKAKINCKDCEFCGRKNK